MMREVTWSQCDHATPRDNAPSCLSNTMGQEQCAPRGVLKKFLSLQQLLNFVNAAPKLLQEYSSAIAFRADCEVPVPDTFSALFGPLKSLDEHLQFVLSQVSRNSRRWVSLDAELSCDVEH